MPRHPSLASAILILAALLVGRHAPVHAQEATPVPTVVGAIAVEETRFGLADIVPAGPALISSYRIDMPPGTELAVAPDPGLELYRVAAGTVTVALAEEITLTRDGVPHEVVPGGEEVQLGPGDGFMWMPERPGEVRNAGTEPVVLLVIVINPEAGLPDAEMGLATPAP
jgi:mannose-6-phosphate isomerase-like protein (cupin superfamily)